MFQKIASIWSKNSKLFINGTITTIKISAVATLIGLLIGLLAGLFRTMPKKRGLAGVGVKFINVLIDLYVLVFRGTPMMVQAMVIFYGFPLYFGLNIPRIPAAYIIVSVNTGAYMTELVRGGIMSVDKGQFEAAKALGLNHFQTMANVILPQALRNILPAVGNEFVINIKDSSVLNVISVSELFFASQSVAGASFDYFNTFAITCAIYLVLTTVISVALRLLEKKLDGPQTYELKMGNQMQV